MAQKPPSYTELVYQVVRESPEPLLFDEVVARVHAIRPITTKNPKSTIRNAVSQAHLIVSIGDGYYGWKPRVITGSVVRTTLMPEDFADKTVNFGDDARDVLYPSMFESQKYSDTGLITVELPNGVSTQIMIQHIRKPAIWGTRGSPEFWAWFDTLNAAPGDHLIVRAVDGDAKLYSVTFERRAERDEAAVAQRNQEIYEAAMAYLRKRIAFGVAMWDMATYLVSHGFYKHSVPPDPLEEIWSEDAWHDLVEPEFDPAVFLPRQQVAPPSLDDPLVQALFGAGAQVYDVDRPPDLPREYNPEYGIRQPRPSAKGKKGPVKTYTLRVVHLDHPMVWRDIEIAEDQNLEDLHLIIQQAYNWYDDHLYSFFMSGQPWDQASEISCPWSESAVHTHQATVGRLELTEGRRFLYLFDYGDDHEFMVEVLKIASAAAKGNYPKIVNRKGKSPKQYPDYE